MASLTRVWLRSNDETLIRVLENYLQREWAGIYALNVTQQIEKIDKNDVLLWDVSTGENLPENAANHMIMLASEAGVRQNHAPAALGWPIRLSELGQRLQAFRGQQSWKAIGGTLRFLAAQRMLENGAAQITLTDKESEILAALLEAKAPLSRDMLMQTVWGYADDVQSHTLETHMHRLRAKLRELGEEVIVHTAEGYVIRP